MEVNLLHATPLWISAKAIRKCRDNEHLSDDKEYCKACSGIVTEDFGCVNCKVDYKTAITTRFCGENNKKLIDRIGNKMKHASTLEHLYYNFEILEISRACLQEMSRHRIASPTVKSTRYTLGELKKESRFIDGIVYNKKTDSYNMKLARDAQKRADKYIVRTGNERVDRHNIAKLDMLRVSVHSGISNDISKYELPECYKVDSVWSINARSLQNFLSLRTNRDALLEIRILAKKIFDSLPKEHKYLFEDCINEI